MAICKKFPFIFFIIKLFLIFFLVNNSYAEKTFKDLENKKVPYLDFFLLKFENKLIQRSQFLRGQLFITRVQYSNISIRVNFDDKNKKIYIDVYAVMDRTRYSKKKYKQKLSDCNQIRNLIFYRKHGYKFFTQKRDPKLSKGLMEDIFIEVFFSNLSFNDEEIDFLMNNMIIKVSILNPISKKELFCSGKVNDYELK